MNIYVIPRQEPYYEGVIVGPGVNGDYLYIWRTADGETYLTASKPEDRAKFLASRNATLLPGIDAGTLVDILLDVAKEDDII